MSTLTVENIDIRVTRKVVQVTPENVEDGSLVDFLETYKIIARKGYGLTNYDPEMGTYEHVEGVEYYEAHNSYPTHFHATYGDYIVILGDKDAYTVTQEELSEKSLGTSPKGKDFREPKLRNDSKVRMCYPRYRRNIWGMA